MVCQHLKLGFSQYYDPKRIVRIMMFAKYREESSIICKAKYVPPGTPYVFHILMKICQLLYT